MSASATPAIDRAHAHADARRPLEPAEIAWLAVLPCAALAFLAIELLGPPLGHAFFAPGPERFWPEAGTAPEPVEHARFVLALLAAPLGAAAIVATWRRGPQMRAPRARTLILATQVATVAFLALTIAAQNEIFFRSYIPPNRPNRIFDVPTLLVAAAFAAAAAVLLRRAGHVARLAAAARETRARRIVCALFAALFVAVWLVHGFNTDRTIGLAMGYNLIGWDLGESFAVLDGRTPLVDFHSQYTQLLPYLGAGALRVLGASIGAWTAAMLTLSGLALLGIYAVFLRIVRSSLLALALYVPFVCGSAFLIAGGLRPLEIFSLWPMRYGGPYLLAWLTARHLDGASPRRRWLLLAVGALVAINNLEFGLAAFGGALAAVAYVDPPRTRGAALRLARDVAAALAAGVAFVSAVTLAHSGSLPQFGLLLEFPRIYGVGGWVLEPMPAVGFHLAMYVTFVAAIAVATVRAVRREAGSVLTGMLVWSGIFGLGASSYYAGRSDVIDLVSLFSAWSLSLLLLAAVVVGRLARTGRRATPGDLAVLFGCGLVAFAITQLPPPWQETARLQRTSAPLYEQRTAVALVKATARSGEPVALFTQLGPRIAHDAHVVDVVPYTGAPSMPTVGQMEETLRAMRRAGVTNAYLDTTFAYQGQEDALAHAGYRPAGEREVFVLMRRASSR